MIDIPSDYFQAITLVGIIFLIIIAQWIVQKFVIHWIDNIEKIPDDMINGLRVFVRIGAAVVVLYGVMFVYNLPFEGIIGVSTLLGAIVSFASVQAIQNFISGLFILLTHPFGIEDFISIDDTEGIVMEISLNYTKIRTVDNTHLYIPNKKILQTTIINYNRKIQKKTKKEKSSQSLKFLSSIFDKEEIVRYSFQWGAPLGNLKKAKEEMELVCELYAPVFGYKPYFFLYTISHRMEFKFIVITNHAEKIIRHITKFRDDIVAIFH